MSSVINCLEVKLWNYVIPHFNKFLSNLELTDNQRSDALTKIVNVGSCLHSHYYVGDYQPVCTIPVGSFGKGTAIRPPSDVDLLYVLPDTVLSRIENLSGNKQSQLLQEIKRILEVRFPNTDMSADGQIVSVPFATYHVDVVPTFYQSNGTFLYGDTNFGGIWKTTAPIHERERILTVDKNHQSKATRLIKMLKAWSSNCTVGIKSVILEVAACTFIDSWRHNNESVFYYDWMIRDFFNYFYQYRNGHVTLPGTGENIPIGDVWAHKCLKAYEHALEACQLEHDDWNYLSTAEWQAIFGNQFEAA